MRHVDFDPAKLTGEQADWWRNWQARADAATVQAIDAWESGEEVTFNEKIWGDLKQWLLDNVFYGKCAYCENLAVRHPGHAEHFRPKGRVDITDPRTGKAVPVHVEWPNGTVATHPGYFWLAYNWKNLLPACQSCNSGRGKQNQFPLSGTKHHALVPTLSAAEARVLAAKARASVKYKQHYYLDPDALDALEQPQILNPYVEDPHRHLRFGEGGVVTAVDDSPKGKASIRVYQLDDESLRVDRQRQQQRAVMVFTTSLVGAIAMAQNVDTAVQTALAALAPFRDGKEPYSTAALDYVDIVVKQIERVHGGGV